MHRRAEVRPILGLHPGLILAALDVIGLVIASYLAVVEVGGGVPVCGPLKGCETVAQSEYSRIGGVPVAVYGVALSFVLLTLAVAWWRTNLYALLLVHYGLSLAGVVFEIYFLYLQIAIIRAICIWCTSYGLSLILRFVVALAVWLRQPRPDDPPEPRGRSGTLSRGGRLAP
ncbi:MAG: vitamin K epoxide reductase family protein [Candidatus Limnocylindrales bacterium]